MPPTLDQEAKRTGRKFEVGLGHIVALLVVVAAMQPGISLISSGLRIRPQQLEHEERIKRLEAADRASELALMELKLRVTGIERQLADVTGEIKTIASEIKTIRNEMLTRVAFQDLIAGLHEDRQTREIKANP